MRRLQSILSLICLLLTVSVTASAQEAANGLPPATEMQAFVRGLSAGDQLNVRAAASPLGKTIGRLPNGALVLKLECKLVDGYEWCLVDALDVADLSGWAPARYLQALDDVGQDMEKAEEAPRETGTAASDAGVPVPRPAPRDTALADVSGTGEAPTETEPSATADGPGAADTAGETRPSAAADAGREARLAGGDTEDLLPPGLEARFAGAAPASLAGERQGEPGSDHPVEAPDATPQAEATDEEPASPRVPIPTPRPGPRAGSSETPAATAPVRGEVAGEVPCARHIGQPMRRCIVLVARNSEDAADVTVVWPDGGTRLIEFRDGVPAGSDSRDAVRFTREGTLNMIRIGTAERFEILDALTFGD